MSMLASFDQQWGGFGRAPKFPQSMSLGHLLRHHHRTGSAAALEAVVTSLDAMASGGMYDHIGGGFSRYSVDERWLVPHFEKMLYDNAQLLELLGVAHAATSAPLFLERARETVGWLAREMTTPEGAFCASLDADSEGEEGKFYVWSLREIQELLQREDAAFFAAQYDVTAGGNFEGHNILNRIKDLPRNMEDPAPSADELARLAMLRGKLLEAREKRIRPGLDDKVLADWNGLMIAALANGGALLDQPGWIVMAKRAFAFIETQMTREDRLGHSWRAGRLLVPGLASDFACMIRAALALYEATGERPYLDRALSWQAALDRHYANPDNGGYFLTADDAEGLVIRPASTTDDATPNPNAIAAQNLVRLAVLAGDDRWREKADRLFEGVFSAAGQNLIGHAALLNALDLRLRGAEIVITGSDERADALLAAALKLPFLSRIILRTPDANALPASHPARDKIAAAPDGAAFVCVGERCSLPVTEAAQVAAAVSAMRSVP